MQTFLIASCLAAATLAAPEAEAALYGNALIGPGGVAPAWPSAVGYGVQSTVYGARPYGHLAYGYGKRSADADADAYYGYGHGLAFAGGYSYGLPGHSYAAVSRVHGLGYYGKRSADADADADADAYYGYGLGYGHGLAYGYGRGYGYGLGVAHHGGHATSFVARSPQGLRGKRSADADAYYGLVGHGLAYGYGVGIQNNNVYSGFTGNHYATALPGHSFAAVTRGKREAEADAFYGYYGRGYGYGHHGGYYGRGYGHGYGYGYYG